MNNDLYTALEKLAWLELYVPVEGATKKLMERLIRRTARKAVLTNANDDTQTRSADNVPKYTGKVEHY